MKLVNIRIQNYKTIDDTDWIPIDPKVTALVGKNESGKTSIMRALWKSRNVIGAKFDKLLDYPRQRYAKERRQKQDVVTLEFLLSPAEGEELRTQFPIPVAAELERVIVKTSYDGEDNVASEVCFSEEVEKLRLCFPSVISQAVQMVLASISASGFPDDAGVGEAAIPLQRSGVPLDFWENHVLQEQFTTFESVLNAWMSRDPQRLPKIKDAQEEFAKCGMIVHGGEPFQKARVWIGENMPVFIYFCNYGQLETRIHLPLYFSRRSQSPDERTRTQTALFDRSSLEPQEILNLGQPKHPTEADDMVLRRKEKRRALLDSASFTMTDEWILWWSEKRHKLHFDADGDDLVLKVSDEHNEFPIPFEERSQGFQWFFSFYLVFLAESEKAHKRAILLLDEPGLHLHPTLQGKLTGLFEKISDSNQLIYSTHLPFLIDGDHLERVRTVYLSGEEPKKTRVSSNVRPVGDRDTLFPLQAALGYSIAQTLFMGKRSVVVEGITDYWIIKALNDALAALGETSTLHQETILVPAGGTSHLMPLASILFGTAGVDGKNLLVLLDDDKAGRNAANLLSKEFGNSMRTIHLSQGTGVHTPTIEDLFTHDTYLEAAKRAGFTIKLSAKEDAEPSIVVAIQAACLRLGCGEFGMAQKAKVALSIIDEIGKKPSSIPAITKERAKALFTAINAMF